MLPFLYLPIVVVVVFSFNGTARRVTDWEGFSLRWYEFVLGNKEVQHYLLNSLIVGVATAIIATLVGTMAALGLQRAPKWFRLPFDALTYISIIVPEIVIALATLVFFASTIGRDGRDHRGDRRGDRVRLPHDHRRPDAVQHQPRAAARPGPPVRDGPDHVEASYDLFATPWRTFWQITFPQLLPAIVAGFLLSFTFAFDDYLITTFVNGRGTSTLPLYVFGQIKRGVTPATNAVAALMLLVTLGPAHRRPAGCSPAQPRRGGEGGQVGGVVGMVAEQSGG